MDAKVDPGVGKGGSEEAKRERRQTKAGIERRADDGGGGMGAWEGEAGGGRGQGREVGEVGPWPPDRELDRGVEEVGEGDDSGCPPPSGAARTDQTANGADRQPDRSVLPKSGEPGDRSLEGWGVTGPAGKPQQPEIESAKAGQ